MPTNVPLYEDELENIQRVNTRTHYWDFEAGCPLETDPLKLSDYPDKTIGSYGSTLNGNTATVKGKVRGDAWVTLTDLKNGSPIIFTDINQVFVIYENPAEIKVFLSGNTNVDFSVGVTSAK